MDKTVTFHRVSGEMQEEIYGCIEKMMWSYLLWEEDTEQLEGGRRLAVVSFEGNSLKVKV